jgi:hypothetical protein
MFRNPPDPFARFSPPANKSKAFTECLNIINDDDDDDDDDDGYDGIMMMVMTVFLWISFTHTDT